HFQDLIDLKKLNGDSRVSRRRGFDVSLHRVNGTCHLNFGASKFKGPARIEAALRFIAENPQFQVKDIGGLPDDKSRVVLARRLVREGFLTISDLAATAVPETEKALVT
ncbi:MAG: hypothetical protein AAF725_09810, partial [Acidobacteriota bacterium]